MDGLRTDALNSFVTLARTRRMSETVRRLGISRQTVSRHLDYLEETFGVPVLLRDGHNYVLTDEGGRVLKQAESLFQLTKALVGGYDHTTAQIDGLEQTRYQNNKGEDYRSQQHAIWRLYEDSPPLLREAYRAWKDADFMYEHEATAPIKPFLHLYRESEVGWFCSHIGEQSAYARWFGWEWAKSAVGTITRNDPGGDDFDRFASQPYTTVLRTATPRLDHHHIKLATRADGTSDYVRYQRLLLPYLLPDRSPVLATVTALTNKIEVFDYELPQESVLEDAFLMENDVSDLLDYTPR